MSARKIFAAGLYFSLSLGVILAISFSSCKRNSETPRAKKENRAHTKAPVGETEEVNAAWYDVPAESLARRRAGVDELTAAHDKLPIGTLVRVTRLENGKSVTVRVTDRGIHDHHISLDLCKEAAEKLEMVSTGIARVRMEVIPDDDTSAFVSPTP
ncbi:MAG: septal ring lytic transglycosylase RlpA family protein [Chthoniobacterales bacterium]